MSENAIVALSGGQDSATCLLHAVKTYEQVEAISFDYGQRHRRTELAAAAALAEELEVPATMVSVRALSSFGGASLTEQGIESRVDAAGTGNDYAAARGLPSSFVPGRNLVLLGLAAAYGIPRGMDVLVTGQCATDEEGYPDCRPDWVAAFEHVVRLGMECSGFRIDAPVLLLDKADTWRLAEAYGGLELVRLVSHTCYEGDHKTLNEWGYGCGECPACKVRAAGWEAFRAGEVTKATAPARR